jgi:hypothetical protein
MLGLRYELPLFGEKTRCLYVLFSQASQLQKPRRATREASSPRDTPTPEVQMLAGSLQTPLAERHVVEGRLRGGPLDKVSRPRGRSESEGESEKGKRVSRVNISRLRPRKRERGWRRWWGRRARRWGIRRGCGVGWWGHPREARHDATKL